MSCRASGDESARFLQELRQLRDGAGLGRAELAARAHYPYDRIRAAEVGPSLPDLPVLSAYVRGCGGTTEEWEERWRSLTSAPTLPLLTARPAGYSTAASAGARIGSISPAADTPDPSIIMAALDRVAEEMAVAAPAPLPSRSGISTLEQDPGAVLAAPAAASSFTSGREDAGQPTAWEADFGSGIDAGPVATAATTAATATAVSGPVTADRQSRATSRITIAALIAVAICVLVAALAIFG
jgi:Helix-turn-helix domain